MDKLTQFITNLLAHPDFDLTMAHIVGESLVLTEVQRCHEKTERLLWHARTEQNERSSAAAKKDVEAVKQLIGSSQRQMEGQLRHRERTHK